jgi:hypothetical protein
MNDIKYGRKRNGIEKHLNAKVNEWLESIKDETVRGLARKNTIVTGGSIASMLLGESVNDYDIYFRDIETTQAVARYYVDQFNKVNNLETADGVAESCAPQVNVEDVTNIKGQVETRVLIYMKSAGVASEEQGTYDYFEMRGEDEQDSFVDSLKPDDDAGKERYRPVFLSANAITLSDKVQLVVRFYGEPDQIHDNYDFVHAMCYWDHFNHELHLPAEALESMLSRTLSYRGSLYPIASIFRAKKFIERGWRISAGQLLKIIWQISEIDMTDFDILREQLTGVDQAYLWQLVSALKDVDPSTINSTYVVAIIDKIFGEYK